MIEFTETNLKLSPAVCKALIAFASTDKTRPSLHGIGINQGNVCATDGHCAVRFQKHTGALPDTIPDGLVFPLEYVKQQLKVAVATKSPAVSLDWLNPSLSHTFPPIHLVETTNRRIKVPAATPIGFDAELLGRIAHVQVACSHTEARKSSATGYQCAKLVSITGPLDPVSFEIGSHSTGHPSTHFARVTVMPVVVDWSTGADD